MGEDSEIELKPYAYKESERIFISVMACLLKNEPTSFYVQLAKEEKLLEPQGNRVLIARNYSCT